MKKGENEEFILYVKLMNFLIIYFTEISCSVLISLI